MSLDPNAAYSSTEKGHVDDVRPSDDSTAEILRPAPRPLEPRSVHPGANEQPYGGRTEYGSHDEPPPARHPSRQIMRYGPPPPASDYGWDDRDERRPYPYGRASYDYGTPSRPPPDDYYADDRELRWHNDRPYRRHSVRESAHPVRHSAQRGLHERRQRRRDRRSVLWEASGDDGSDDDDDDTPRRKKRTSRASSPPLDEIGLRLPFLRWMNGSLKAHFIAVLGEFVGTTMFLFFAFAGTQVANSGNNSESNTTTGQATGFSPIVLLYIGIAFGFSLMVNVWIFFRISGGLFNPAVTLAMVMVNAISIIRALLLLGAQLAGAIFSSYIVKILFPTSFNVRTTLSAQTSLVAGVFIEAILTAELVFTIFMLAKEKHKATFMAPIGIGMALFVAELVGVYYTGGSLNPARSFGPCVITGTWDKEHWVYWVGPAIGAIAAVCFYKFIKILEYEIANPGQDENTEEKAAEAAGGGTPVKRETV
ncbi:hypothetical protein LTR62_006476 [Meristemomyces frigidus]|uniref:Aquaporin n=1 Tax=Meristemomyces frigidus TaxID=1508187 RepID=A0AAN7YEG7_9PEZI|nr:hypothetical protein LTR62_006476 [Meristemomyces frigidus]